jgi:hypothetical protein
MGREREREREKESARCPRAAPQKNASGRVGKCESVQCPRNIHENDTALDHTFCTSPGHLLPPSGTAAGVAFSGGRVRRVACGRARHPRPPGPVIGRPNAEILHHGPPPAYAHGREALLAWPRRGRRCTPASCAGHARRQACERFSAGWRVPAEPTMLRLNSHFLGFRIDSRVQGCPVSRWSAPPRARGKFGSSWCAAET